MRTVRFTVCFPPVSYTHLRLSENAFNAVGLAFPLQSLMIAVGAGTAVGINALLSRSCLLYTSLIVEYEAVPGGEIVNVVPQPKAGSSFATAAYKAFRHPVALEEIRADAGLDIGGTLILSLIHIFSFHRSRTPRGPSTMRSTNSWGVTPASSGAVSYTHLDVYKRQVHQSADWWEVVRRGTSPPPK